MKKLIILLAVILVVLTPLPLMVGCRQPTQANPWTTYTTNTTNGGLASNNIWVITQDNQGNLWFGTNGGGVTRYDGMTWKTFTSKDGLAGDSVSAILPDKRDNIWFATSDKRPGIDSAAVSRYDGINWTSFNYKNGLLGIYANAIEEDNRGNIWVGTGTIGGVSYYDGTAWHTFTTKEGLAGGDIRAVFKDRKGNLWFGTNGGGVSCCDMSLKAALPPPINPETIPDRKITIPDIGPVFRPTDSSISIFINNSNLPGVGMTREIVSAPEKKATVFEVYYGYKRGNFGDFQGIWSKLVGIEYGDKIGWIAKGTKNYDFDASDTYLFTEEFWKLFESKDDWHYHYTFLPFLAADPDVPREVLQKLANGLSKFIQPTLAESLLNNLAARSDIEILRTIASLSAGAYSEVSMKAQNLLSQTEPRFSR